MSIELKGFISRDDFITPRNQEVSPIYELSNISNTYSSSKLIIHPVNKQTYTLHVFNLIGASEVTNNQGSLIISIVEEFSNYLTNNPTITKLQTIINFTNNFNVLYSDKPVTNFNYNNIISYEDVKIPDYLTFTIDGIMCSIWLSDELFQTFYPEYDIKITLPFENFANIIQNTSSAIDAISDFDPVSFNTRLQDNREGHSATYTRIVNIPYKVPNTSLERNCYFGFNIYGRQGNYDHILKLELYRLMTEELGLDGSFVEEVFPNILNINEFFIVPRWDKLAIQTQVGQVGVGSQLSMTYNEVFDTNKYIKVYKDDTYLRNNTYNLPIPYNNLLLNVTNGFYSEDSVKQFNLYYPDIISVGTSHPDFGRMSSKTAHFLMLLDSMLYIADTDSQTELFNKVLQSTEYNVTIVGRGGISYISAFYDKHQYYVLPKYQMLSLI